MSNANYPDWTATDVAIWKTVGGHDYLLNYKDGWIKHNAENIQEAAQKANIPPSVLAGVAWIEAGGDPIMIDSVAYNIRAIDHSGPNWVDERLTMTSKPEKTSLLAMYNTAEAQLADTIKKAYQPSLAGPHETQWGSKSYGNHAQCTRGAA